MAGFERIVRPMIFPDIRPRPRQSLPPQDDPTKGFAVIAGNPARQVSLSYSESVSSSKSSPKEVERRVDEVRVYQMEDDGTVNKDNFVDLQVPNKITMEEPVDPGSGSEFGGEGGGAGGGGVDPGRGSGKGVMKEYFYERMRQQEENIEVKRRNVIMRNGEEFKG